MQMGPVVAAKEWGSFSLIRTNENRPICVRGNDLSRRHTGGALGIVGPGSKAQSKTRRFAHAVPRGSKKSQQKFR